jgi:hypothetical protein
LFGRVGRYVPLYLLPMRTIHGYSQSRQSPMWDALFFLLSALRHYLEARCMLLLSMLPSYLGRYCRKQSL